MGSVELVLDGLFSADAVARTAQRYTNEFYVEIATVPSGHQVRLTPIHDGALLDHLTQRFRNDALDERLRERVRAETAELQIALIEAALQGAQGIGRAR
ncbi:hypothetical protein [Lysobacter terrae]